MCQIIWLIISLQTQWKKPWDCKWVFFQWKLSIIVKLIIYVKAMIDSMIGSQYGMYS